jgi:hypothetical protein
LKQHPVDHFAAVMDSFSGTILSGTTRLTPEEERLNDIRVLATITEAMKSGRTVMARYFG